MEEQIMNTNLIENSYQDAVANLVLMPKIPDLPHLQKGNAVDRGDFVKAMGAAVTGVNVVTTDGRLGRFGLAVSAMSSLSADSPHASGLH